MPTFALPWIAIAGLIGAAGPLLIHLLNRRRFRIVHWAAMDFLREAIQRSHRILRLRDVLLMVLRMLCVAAFGAALARPLLGLFGTAGAGPNQPVHAVVLVDNSMGMGYQKQDGILLDDAKAKAKDLIERLPRGSQVSVLPTCGSPRAVRYEPYWSPEDALEALAAMQPIDRAMQPDTVLDLAADACRLSPMTPKRIVLVTAQPVASWPAETIAAFAKRLPCPMEFSPIAVEQWENAWIADLKLRDGIADTQTPATLVATIGYEGPAPRRTEAALSIEGVKVATIGVDLQPGQRREVEFPSYRFDLPVQRGALGFATAEVSLPHDRLPADDQRWLIVPVVAGLPVVFVDALGRDEAPQNNRYGETHFLRRLLAPRTSRAAPERQLVDVRQAKIDQLSPDLLADARLVVVAGVRSPGRLVPLLREYVEQGGNLLIAAGGQFDPAAWNDAAWNNGQGILPAPLRPVPVGKLPNETTGQLRPFFLDFDTLVHDYFLPEGTRRDELKALFNQRVLFFKAVAADVSDDAQRQATQAADEYFRAERSRLEELDRQEAALKTTDAAYPRQRAELDRQRAALRANWLQWKAAQDSSDGQRSVEELADRARPRVLGRFTNGLPFIVARHWGRGQVLLITTSVSTDWNSMAIEQQAVWVYDRILRSLLHETFPQRNLRTEDSLVLPVAPAERAAQFTLVDANRRQAGPGQALAVDALGGDRYGITLGNWTQRGVYRVTAAQARDSRQPGLSSKLWEVPIAVNGPAGPSDLVATADTDAGASPTNAAHRYPSATSHPTSATSHTDSATSEAIVALAEQPSAGLWKWVLGSVLAGLALELGVLAIFSRRTPHAPRGAEDLPLPASRPGGPTA